MFDAMPSSETIRTGGKLILAGGVVYGASEFVLRGRVSETAALAVGLGAATYLVGKVSDLPGASGHKQMVAGPDGANAAVENATIARDLGDQRERETQVKHLPWIVGGAVVGLGVLRLLLL